MATRIVRLTGYVSAGGRVQVATDDGSVKEILLEGKPVETVEKHRHFSGSVEFHVTFVDRTVEFYPDGKVELPDA